MEALSFEERVAQPLLLQGPLQAVLLDLYRQLQAQSSTIEGLQASLGALDAREREGRQVAASAEARSREALCQLEMKLAAERLSAQQERRDAEARLQHLELRLHGASNLAGRQAALDDIASMLGVSVPEVEAPELPQRGLAPDEMGGQHAVAAAAGLADSFGRANSSSFSASTTGLGAPESNTAEPASAAGSSTLAPQPANDALQEAAAAGTEPEATRARSSTPLPPSGGPPYAAEASSRASSESAEAGGLVGPALRPASRASVVRPSSRSHVFAGTSEGNERSGSAAVSRGSSTSPDNEATQQSLAHSGSRRPSGAASLAAAAATSRKSSAAAHPSVPGGPAADAGLGGLEQVETSVPVVAQGSRAARVSNGGSTAGPAASLLSGADSGSAGSQQQPAAAAAHFVAPSPAALFAAMQESKARAAAVQPAKPGTAPWTAEAQRARTPPAHDIARPGQQAGVVPHEGAADDAAAVQAASSPDGVDLVACAEGDEHAPTTARPKSAAAWRLVEVVNILRKRPSLKETGLLWKLQASLAENVEEQERLRREVHFLHEQLEALQAVAGPGLESCNRRIDGVEQMVATLDAEGSSDTSGPSTARSVTPRVSVQEFKALEERVGALGSQVEAGATRLTKLSGKVEEEASKLSRLDGQVQEGATRIGRLEEQQETTAAAARLARASSSGSSADTLSALQGHLLTQQQKLQEKMEALAAGIRQGLPGQVHDAVTGAVVEVGRGLERKLSEKLATKQDLQTMSIKLGSKVSREEVERMLRAHRGSLVPTAEPGSGPAAGMRFKCISCDSDMQPFVFAAPLGSLPGGAGTADLRYSQVPAASPPRSAGQPWTAATAGASLLGAPPSAAALESSRLSSGSGVGAVGSPLPAAQVQLHGPPLQQALLPARPSTGAASRLGAPVSWMHRMRRDSGATSSLDGGGGPASRRDSLHEQQLQHQPSLTAVGIARPHTAFPISGASSGGLSVTPRASLSMKQQALALEGQAQQDGDGAGADFFEAIREEPPLAGAGSSEMAGSAPIGGGLLSSSSSKGEVLPALAGSPGRIKASRPATALPSTGGGATSDAAEGGQRSSTPGGGGGLTVKRHSTGMAGAPPV